MNRKEILIELIGHYCDYTDGQPQEKELSMDDFLGYMNARKESNKVEMRKFEGDEETWLKENHRKVNNDISILLVFMYRYAKGYIKKALKNSVLQTPEEFTFLITLMTYTSLTKSKLINTQILEKTSGTEVIKRLVKLGLILELEDVTDKRSMQVSITDAGREEILKLLPVIDTVADIVIANLNPEERNILAYLLNKMDMFHNDIYQHRKNEDLVNLVYSDSKNGLSK